MEFGLSRTTRTPEHPTTTTNEENKMSMIAMAAPSPHSAFRKEFAWEEHRHVEYSSRPRTEPERIALPSIRQVLESAGMPLEHSTNAGSQAIPELRMPLGPQDVTKSSTTSPTVGVGAMTPPEYVHSPTSNKRRRLSVEDDQENERARQVPRRYNSPPRMAPQQLSQPQISSSSSCRPSPTLPPCSGTDSWPTRTSPYSASGALPAMRSPHSLEPEQRVVAAPEPRPTLPSLPLLNFDKSPVSAPAPLSRYRSHSGDDYPPPPEPSRIPQGSIESSQARPFSFAAPQPSYQHPSRAQSLSLGSVHHQFDHAPFSSSAPSYPAPVAAAAAAAASSHHHHPYPEYLRMGDVGMGLGYGMPGMGIGGIGADCTKQRKRRGNLPKETTDKLRSWFMAHLHHPYPTEDEKQDLMRQTGLQMNQISNWFINARRRALPQMLNDQRMAEAKAAAQGAGSVLPSTERGDYDARTKRDSVPLSDGGAGPYDEDLDHRRAGVKRGSI